MGAADSLCRHFRTPFSVHFNISFYSEAPSFIGSIPYGFDSARQQSGSEVRSKTAFQYLANLRVKDAGVKVALLVSDRAVHQSTGAFRACGALELSLVCLGVFVLALHVLHPAVAGTP